MNCAKKAEPIEMPFEGIDSGGPKEPCIGWEPESPKGRGIFEF